MSPEALTSWIARPTGLRVEDSEFYRYIADLTAEQVRIDGTLADRRLGRFGGRPAQSLLARR